MKKSDFERRWQFIQFTAIFVLLYLDIGVGIGALKVPSATALAIFLIMGGTPRALIVSIPILTVLTAVALFTSLSSPANPPPDNILSSWLQTCVGVLISVLVFRRMMQFRISVLKKASVFLLILFSSVTLLEFLGPLASASSWFGSQVYSGEVGFTFYGLAEYSLERDISLVGSRRPTAFSAEPSIAALGFSIVCLLTYFSRRDDRWLVGLCFVLLLTWPLFRSPIPLGAAALMAILGSMRMGAPLRSSMRIALFGALGVAMTALILLRVSKLMEDPTTFVTTSEGIRLVLPLINTMSSWGKEFGFLGAGPGAIYDVGYVSNLNSFASGMFGTNAVLEMLFYYGPIFSVIMIALYYRTLARAARRKPGAVEAILVFAWLGFSTGAIDSIRLFGMLGILLGVSARAQFATAGAEDA